jgi:hypothetical protein
MSTLLIPVDQTYVAAGLHQAFSGQTNGPSGKCSAEYQRAQGAFTDSIDIDLLIERECLYTTQVERALRLAILVVCGPVERDSFVHLFSRVVVT